MYRRKEGGGVDAITQFKNGSASFLHIIRFVQHKTNTQLSVILSVSIYIPEPKPSPQFLSLSLYNCIPYLPQFTRCFWSWSWSWNWLFYVIWFVWSCESCKQPNSLIRFNPITILFFVLSAFYHWTEHWTCNL